MRLIRNILIVIIFAFFALVIFRETVLKAVVRLGVKDIFGLTVEVDRLDIGVLKSVINIQGLKVYNPKNFPEKLMLDLPEFYANYAFFELIKGHLVLKELRVNLEEFQIVKAKDGSTNIGQLKGVVRKAQTKEKEEPAKRGKPAVFKIDLLKLRISRLVYKDHSVSPPSTKTFQVNIHKEFYNIDDPAKFVSVMVLETLLKSGIRELTDVDLSSMQRNAKSILGSSKDLVLGTASLATGVAKGAVGTTTNVIKKTVGSLGSFFKSERREKSP